MKQNKIKKEYRIYRIYSQHKGKSDLPDCIQGKDYDKLKPEDKEKYYINSCFRM